MRIENQQVFVSLHSDEKNNRRKELQINTNSHSVEYFPYEDDNPVGQYEFDGVCNGEISSIFGPSKIEELVQCCLQGVNCGLLLVGEQSHGQIIVDVLKKLIASTNELHASGIKVFLQHCLLGITDKKCVDLADDTELPLDAYRNIDYYWDDICSSVEPENLVNLMQKEFSLPFLLLVKVFVYPEDEAQLPLNSTVLLGNLKGLPFESEKCLLRESWENLKRVVSLQLTPFVRCQLPVFKTPLTSILSRFVGGDCKMVFISQLAMSVQSKDDLFGLELLESLRKVKNRIQQNLEDGRFRDLLEIDEIAGDWHRKVEISESKMKTAKSTSAAHVKYLEQKIEIAALEAKELKRLQQLELDKQQSVADQLKMELAMAKEKFEAELKRAKITLSLKSEECQSISKELEELEAEAANSKAELEDKIKKLNEKVGNLQKESDGAHLAKKKLERDLEKLEEELRKEKANFESKRKETETEIEKERTKMSREAESEMKNEKKKLGKDFEQKEKALQMEMEKVKKQHAEAIRESNKQNSELKQQLLAAKADLDVMEATKVSELAILRKEIDTLKSLSKSTESSQVRFLEEQIKSLSKECLEKTASIRRLELEAARKEQENQGLVGQMKLTGSLVASKERLPEEKAASPIKPSKKVTSLPEKNATKEQNKTKELLPAERQTQPKASKDLKERGLKRKNQIIEDENAGSDLPGTPRRSRRTKSAAILKEPSDMSDKESESEKSSVEAAVQQPQVKFTENSVRQLLQS